LLLLLGRRSLHGQHVRLVHAIIRGAAHWS